MALQEIDEAELMRLRRIENTVGAIVKNPSAKKALAKAIKEVLPDDPLAKEADKVDPIEARFNSLEEQNLALKKQIADEAATREKDARIGSLKTEQEQGFAALRAAKWTAEGIAKVKEVMEEKGILDVEIAASWVEKQMPQQSPITPGGSGNWGFFDAPTATDDDIKKLIETRGESVPLVHKMAMDAIQELRGPQRR